ncbi:hypothetical protein [uncultured Nocardioides sp.]|uniref:hypothetical protein n=1 Tax=uncultured Nocardioides sp. TaxID=198441 RepID=UPI0026151AB8|nr:hypothetical protein [uncultured Nocardioides sp.]
MVGDELGERILPARLLAIQKTIAEAGFGEVVVVSSDNVHDLRGAWDRPTGHTRAAHEESIRRFAEEVGRAPRQVPASATDSLGFNMPLSMPKPPLGFGYGERTDRAARRARERGSALGRRR